jgi:DNA ligase (NAD+)
MSEDKATQAKIDHLAKRLEAANTAYRAGESIMSDTAYDELTEALRELAPEHPFLGAVEEENLPIKDQVRHSAPMLSTEKAYTAQDLERWVERIRKATVEMGIAEVTFRMTPKLDGLAGRDEAGILATRGNGRVGYDITSAFAKGLIPIGGRGQGVGEIVLQDSWFNEHLSEIFDHPRNVAVGIVKADVVNENAQRALDAGMVHFVPYTQLADWQGSAEELLARSGEITAELKSKVDYPLDGMVVEALGDALREYMGATSHHHRWQIALKERGQLAHTTVEQVIWQTGRTGNVTPVMQVKPVRVSGATISRVTAHHAGMIRDKGIGPGAEIEISRSGEVIPKLETVLKAVAPDLVSVCPSCQTELVWKNDFLNCENGMDCDAQVHAGLRHWFRTLKTADNFGPVTIETLVDNGFRTLPKVYAVQEGELLKMGFGPGQTQNLLDALQISRSTPIEDARWLAAFGIHDLGVGDSRKLLRAFPLRELDQATAEQILAVKGFGEITSQSITKGLARRWPVIASMLSLGFNLLPTELDGEKEEIESPISGKRLLFTGKMLQGTRDDMQTRAKALGAVLASGVSKNLDLLVIGEKASPGKVGKAEKAGVQVIKEAEYLALIAGA